MKKMKNEYCLANVSGITLISLIVTIIILLILTTVSVRLISNNGIIGKTEEQVNKYTEEEIKERIRVAYLAYENEKLAYSGYTFKEALTAEEVIYKNLTGSDEEGYTVTVELKNGEKKYIINSDGSIGNVKTLADYGDIIVGDKINYIEGTGYTSTPDTSKGIGSDYDSSTGSLSTATYVNEDLNWRVLGVNESGQIELISTNPTTSKLCIYGEQGYVNAVSEGATKGTLDTFCDELYGNGTGAISARSLTAEDINKLTGYSPTEFSKYGVRWKYRYSTDAKSMQSSSSTDDGKNWSDWVNIIDEEEISYQTFKVPGSNEIISASNPREVEQKYTGYYYKIADKTTEKIENDAILLSDFLTKGEDNSSNVGQWLSTHMVDCFKDHVDYSVSFIMQYNGAVEREPIIFSYGEPSGMTLAIRPVVTLSSNITITGNSIDGWNIVLND